MSLPGSVGLHGFCVSAVVGSNHITNILQSANVSQLKHSSSVIYLAGISISGSVIAFLT